MRAATIGPDRFFQLFAAATTDATKHQPQPQQQQSAYEEQHAAVANKTSEIISTPSTIVLLHRALFCCLGNKNKYFNQAQIPGASTPAPLTSGRLFCFSQHPDGKQKRLDANKLTLTTAATAATTATATAAIIVDSNDSDTVLWNWPAMSSNLGASGGATQPAAGFQAFGGPGAAASGSAVNTNNSSNKNNDSSCSSSNTEDSNEIEDRRRRIKNRTR